MRDFEDLDLSKLSPRLQGLIGYALSALYHDSKHDDKSHLTISMGFSASDAMWLLGAAIELELAELKAQEQPQ